MSKINGITASDRREDYIITAVRLSDHLKFGVGLPKVILRNRLVPAQFPMILDDTFGKGLHYNPNHSFSVVITEEAHMTSLGLSHPSQI